MQRKKVGFLGESFAVKLLVKNGYKVIERNFKTRFGEIDIVALKDSSLIFVEVKTRYSLKFGKPEEAVTPRKVFKITKVGDFYSNLHPELPKKLRIDVVSLLIEGGRVKSAKIIQAT